MKKITFAFIILVVIFASCKKNNDDININKGGIFKGPEATLYSGKVSTWVELNNDGNPQRVGISLDDAALNSVPAGTAPEEGDEEKNMLSLQFDSKAAVTPFTHVGLDWNPVGHEPNPIYTKPHFDFHFNIISEEDRLAIPLYEQDSLKFKNIPASDYVPANYMYFGGGVPQMGAHLVDVTSPELDPVYPQLFTQTFIYGSYDGKIIFYEPMITLDFLKGTTNFERQIPQPAKFQKTGYYPTIMKVSKHDGVTDVILDGFVYKQAS